MKPFTHEFIRRDGSIRIQFNDEGYMLYNLGSSPSYGLWTDEETKDAYVKRVKIVTNMELRDIRPVSLINE